jgi:cytochrome c-type biogenesis protein
MVPVYLASLAGPQILEEGARRRRLPLFLHSLFFVIGFTAVFTFWGAGAGLIGSTLVTYSVLIRYISGSIIIFFGVLMLASLKIPWLNYERRLNISPGGSGYVRSLLTGGVFCLAWTPCLGGPIVSILSLAGGSGTVWQGTYLLAVYSLGLGIPFLAMGIAFDFLAPLLKRFYHYSTWVYIISSLLLITIGILILTNRLLWLS